MAQNYDPSKYADIAPKPSKAPIKTQPVKAQPPTQTAPPPSTSQGLTLEDALAKARNPNAIPASGSGADRIENIYQILGALKGGVQAGKLNVTDYTDVVEPLMKFTQREVDRIAQSGSKGAQAVVPIYQKIAGDGYITNDGTNWKVSLPFSAREYAKLPDNVLPTQDDVQKGLFNQNIAPIERYRTDTATAGAQPGQPGTPPSQPSTPTVPTVPAPATQPVVPTAPQPTDQAGLPPPMTPAPTSTPLPQTDASIPANVDQRTDRGQIETEAQRQAREMQDTLNKQLEVYQQGINSLSGTLGQIPGYYEQAAQRQQQQSLALADQQKAQRAQDMQNLAGILAKQNQQQFERSIPQIAEQANNQGIFRSTGYGEALAKYQNQLEQDRQNQLGLYGVQGEDQYLQQQQNALGQAQSLQEQGLGYRTQNQQTLGAAQGGAVSSYAQGLQDITNQRLGLQTGGLQRQFSLDDYTKQLNLAKQTGQAVTPPSTGKASGALAGAIGGGTAGAQVKGPAGPWAALGGAGLGAVLGGKGH